MLSRKIEEKSVLSLDERLERFMFQSHAWRPGWNVWSSDSKRQDFGVFVLFVAPRCRGNSLENGNTSCLVPATGLETQLASLTDGLWAWTGCSKSRGKKNLGSFTAPNSAFKTAPPLKRFCVAILLTVIQSKIEPLCRWLGASGQVKIERLSQTTELNDVYLVIILDQVLIPFLKHKELNSLTSVKEIFISIILSKFSVCWCGKRFYQDHHF